MEENGSGKSEVVEDCSELRKEIEELKMRIEQYEQSIANHRRLLLSQLEPVSYTHLTLPTKA